MCESILWRKGAFRKWQNREQSLEPWLRFQRWNVFPSQETVPRAGCSYNRQMKPNRSSLLQTVLIEIVFRLTCYMYSTLLPIKIKWARTGSGHAKCFLQMSLCSKSVLPTVTTLYPAAGNELNGLTYMRRILLNYVALTIGRWINYENIIINIGTVGNNYCDRSTYNAIRCQYGTVAMVPHNDQCNLIHNKHINN